MSSLTDAHPRRSGQPAPALFAAAIFLSAGLVFIVQPMVARMILPRLGGSSMVWNTSLAFFQTALLAGYAYAHWLQRMASMRRQMITHLAVLAVAALVLPLRISGLLGDPNVGAPALWLAGVLTLSIGAPFAALSATAPLVQAWYARTHGQGPQGRDPYVLYAASNLGSLLALLAYPIAVEPLMRLGWQSLSWSLGYGLFGVLMVGLITASWRSGQTSLAVSPADRSPPVAWRDRLIWLLLSAATSSLLLGVTGHITSDVASAPFLWVIPLALYLVAFIVAFQARPVVPRDLALLLQAGLGPAAVLLFTAPSAPILLQLPIHLAAYFFTVLVCVQTLAAKRPHPDRLTEFYLWMSLGGVVGGVANAFVAPIVFDGVWEYPIVLVLACMARPLRQGRLSYFQTGCVVAAVLCAVVLLLPLKPPATLRMALLMAPAICALLVRDNTRAFLITFAALAAACYLPGVVRGGVERHRSYFGVVQIGDNGGPANSRIRVMVHGSTLHGTQMQDPTRRCQPTTYYAPATPIGQVFRTEQARRPALSIGAVGLGTGTVAAYVRKTDRLRFFEIDPLMVRIAFDPAKFSYVRGCAQGPIDLTLGDARLSLEKTPDATYDLLLVDAFSSDSVPTHLMTVEAMRTYLRVIKPGGVAFLHLSNRNLELGGPAGAAVRQAGGAMLGQTYYSTGKSPYIESSSEGLLIARDETALDAYRGKPGWTPPVRRDRYWTDDYINVAGALWSRLTTKIQGP